MNDDGGLLAAIIDEHRDIAQCWTEKGREAFAQAHRERAMELERNSAKFTEIESNLDRLGMIA